MRTGTLREQRLNVHGSSGRQRSKIGKLRIATTVSVQGEDGVGNWDVHGEGFYV
uniref:Uncharacterized protein n=1 Tax=Cucumis melo TaxID=3656 RepID=A0A9I9CU24_CUCME